MFLQFRSPTGATSQHFRVAISRNLYTSCLLLHFGGVTVSSGGLPLDTFVFYFQKNIIFLSFLGVTPPTSQHFRVAIPIISHTSRLLFQIVGVIPRYPRGFVRDVCQFLASHSINVETSRTDSRGYQVTPRIHSRRLELCLVPLQEKSIPPYYFCGSGGQPLGSSGPFRS